MWENKDQKNSEYGHFSRSERFSYFLKKILAFKKPAICEIPVKPETRTIQHNLQQRKITVKFI